MICQDPNNMIIICVVFIIILIIILFKDVNCNTGKLYFEGRYRPASGLSILNDAVFNSK